MAGCSSPTKPVFLASKTVQEVLSEGEMVPENYIHKYGVADPNITSVELMDVPVIDLGLLTPSSITVQEDLEKLRSALTTWGCFQAVNHGMTPEFLDEVREITKQFFATPVEEKQKYMKPVNDIEGYGNDKIISEQQTLDWNDRLFLTLHPEDQRKLMFWPENPESFRDTIHLYTRKLQMVTQTVLKAMTGSLNLEDECFLDEYGEKSKMAARFNFYPPCSRPDHVLGVKPHADASMITILLQDKDVEGLQFLKDGKWFRAPIIHEALLINAGDLVEILTNGMFKSPVHKVVTNSKKGRISLAVFCVPDSEKEIEPFQSLINETSRPRLYKKVKNYAESDIYFEYYQQGRRPIEAAMI